jgi:3-hydroxyacyl-[acyl-carrier-protein] dehydratase
MAAGTVETVLTVARNHPAYDGHFPGHPILPGVVILAEVLAAIEAATTLPPERWEIANAKFLEPVLPGAALTLAHEIDAAGSVRFEVRSAQVVVARGTLARRP